MKFSFYIRLSLWKRLLQHHMPQRVRFQQLEAALIGLEQAVPLHQAQLPGEGAAVAVEVVGQLDAGVGNGEGEAVVNLGLAEQVGAHLGLLLLKSLRAKVCAYLLSEAEVHHSLTFTIPYSRIQLADYLNCDRSALSRELSLMQRDGLLETYRSSFKLLEPEALRRMVL